MHRYFTKQQRILCRTAVAERIDTLTARMAQVKDGKPIEYDELLLLRDEYRKLHVKLNESTK